jgi:CDK-activating kinase assembly factor MAT1
MLHSKARGDARGAEALQLRAVEEKKARSDALEVDTEGLSTIYNIPLPTTQASTGDHSDPLSVHYDGPYIPIPYSNPDEAVWQDWVELLDDYVDGRSGVLFVKEDRGGVVRGGGYDLREFWTNEVRSGVEGLGARPIAWENENRMMEVEVAA